MIEHHWSGWPGAFCLHCGAPDLWEIAIGRGLYDPYNETWTDAEETDVLKETMENYECPIEYSKHCGQCKYGRAREEGKS